jgi:hypothetical protein
LIVKVPYSGPSTMGAILAVTGGVSRFSNCRKYVAYSGYFPEKAFRGSLSTLASEQELTDLRANLDEKFEVMETHLRQIEG